MNKFTLGPWKVKGWFAGGIEVEDSNDRTICVCDNINAVANSLVISKVPEMYEFLHDFLFPPAMELNEIPDYKERLLNRAFKLMKEIDGE